MLDDRHKGVKLSRKMEWGTSYSPPVKWKVIVEPTQVKTMPWDVDQSECIVLPCFLTLFSDLRSPALYRFRPKDCPPSVWWACRPLMWWAIFGKFHPFLMSAFSFDLSSVIWFLLSSVVCRLSSDLCCRLSSVVWFRLSSVICFRAFSVLAVFTDH